MTKIVRTFVIQQSFDLLRAVTEAQPIARRVKRDIGGASTSMLETIISEITSCDEARFVIFLSLQQLKSRYLKSGGGQAVIDPALLPDDKLMELAKNPKASKLCLKQLPQNFSFKDLVTSPVSSGQKAVLLNIPLSVVAQLGKAANEDEVKAILKSMMNHHYYVCTLDVARAGQIETEMDLLDAVGDHHGQAEIFNPNILENYPSARDLAAARNEWDTLHSEEGKADAEVADLEKKGDRAEKIKTANAKINADKGTFQQQLIDIIAKHVIGTAFNVDDAVSEIHTTFRDSALIDITKELKILTVKLGSKYAEDTRVAIEALPSW